MSDHKHASAEQPESFKAWVCQNLKCMEWGRADDAPQICVCGSLHRRVITLVARSDAEQMIREAA